MPPLVANAQINYSEQREPCAVYKPLKQPLFGDLHVHTRYSFDSYISSQRNDPFDAYRFAKGEAISLPDADGKQTITAQLERPLDFTAVTDHAEFLGQISICTEDAGKLGYWWPHCGLTRASNFWLQLIAANWWTGLGGQQEDETESSFACNLSDCKAADADVWQRIQQAAEQHYDRSSECGFTTFVGYEYTDAPSQNNMHRNVIFRNAQVTERPVSTYDTGRGNFPDLWRKLREQCTDLDNGCDVMSIPHNPNLAGGLMFRDPPNDTELADRLFFEPVVELTQHKGASECRFDKLAGIGLDTTDELCNFEQVAADNLTMLGSVHGEVRTERARAVPMQEFAPRNMLRNALKAGLAIEQQDGENPFVMGFIGSTDTHSATPGAAEEDPYLGHLGRRDSEYRNVQDHFFSNAGGHAVVWAEENSRDAIFNAIQRKETYATSGTRPVVRFFGGTQLNDDLCDSSDMLQEAYSNGVPMGGEFVSEANEGVAQAPRFLLSATKDAGTRTRPGTDLQRLQIIKGWVDAEGQTHEQVFDVAGDANNGAGVNPANCATTGNGATNLCAVWQDPDFNAQQSAFYYARVLENPSCRWSTLQCQAAGVNPFADNCAAEAENANQRAHERGAEGPVYDKCCLDPATEPFYTPVIQERAWTSPIWVKSQ
ncbi:MAG: DUF3604 domain-containing protein [Gammaproteobacteria bacterium]|nr:DUF3604 domain-containing protein [Gammaproteobacteria bacterium]